VHGQRDGRARCLSEGFPVSTFRVALFRFSLDFVLTFSTRQQYVPRDLSDRVFQDGDSGRVMIALRCSGDCAEGLFLCLYVRDDAMKRWSTHAIIAVYLGILTMGVVVHAVQFREHSHPLKYFVIWDMFCGWSAWEQRTHILGEGESGEFYELAPGPWGSFSAYSENLSRQHYDPFAEHMLRQAQNSLARTSHEPIRRILVVEESWAKKYNLPAHLAGKLTPTPTDKQSYIHIRDIFLPDGTSVEHRGAWLARQAQAALLDNPRLEQLTMPRFPVVAMNRAE
jgi:hypothetical protein